MSLQISQLWNRLPVILRAVLTGSAAATFGTVPWALLAGANLKFGSAVPWAALVMAVYLWFYWSFLRGEGWPSSTAEVRRTNSRVNSLPDEVWGAAILAGFLGLIAVVLFQGVMERLVRLPTSPVDDLSQIPFFTIAVSLIMSSIVAGVVEETSFRGYIQGPIERQHGPVIAILVTGALFGFAHFTHPEVTLILMPWYMAIAVLYGTIAYLTNSTLPGIVLHAGGNILGYIGQLTSGKTEWQGSRIPHPLIWETGVDGAFVATTLAFLVMAGVAVGAYVMLASVCRKAGIRHQVLET